MPSPSPHSLLNWDQLHDPPSGDEHGAWKRAHGNEQWEFDEHGLMRRREASINDVPITETERLFRWPLGPRPEGHPGLTELGL